MMVFQVAGNERCSVPCLVMASVKSCRAARVCYFLNLDLVFGDALVIWQVFLRRRGVEDGEEESHGEESVDASVRVSSESFLEKRGRHGVMLRGITLAFADE